MEKKRIWIVTELFYPEETAVAYIFTRIANHLSNDYKISVISGPEFYDKNKQVFKDSTELSKNIEVFRIKTLKFDKNSLIQRAIKVFLLSIQMCVMVLKRIPRGEIVILATNPAILLLLMSWIKKMKKFHLHILVHDVFPENTLPAQIIKDQKSFVYRFLKFSFDRAYSTADHLIAIGRDMEVVLSKKTKDKTPISVVTNWATNTMEHSNLMIKTFDKNSIIFQYAGNIGRVQALDFLLDSFIQANNRNLYLKIRGTGALFSSIESRIKSVQLPNISLMGGYSREEEFSVLLNCDISIVALSKGMYGLGVPSKTYNILAAGKPILFIGEPKSEIALIIEEFDVGWVIDITKPNDLIEFFANFCITEIDLVDKGQRALSLAKNQFREEKVMESFQKSIELH